MKRLGLLLLSGLAVVSLTFGARMFGVSAQAHQTKAILRPQADSHIVVLDTGSNGTITLTTQGVARMVIDASGNVGIGTTSPTVKLEVNGNVKAANLETQTGSHVHIYLNQCGGGPCGGHHGVGVWTDVAAYNYNWGVNINTDPALFTHNGQGRVTIGQAGTYLIRISTMTVPAVETTVPVYGCPVLNGAPNCGSAGGVGGLFHAFHPAGWWAKTRNEFVFNLGQGVTIGYGYYALQDLTYWAHDWYTAVEITKIK